MEWDDKRDLHDKYIPDDLKIGIVLGGYLNDKDKLMTRVELNDRITGLKDYICKLKQELEKK